MSGTARVRPATLADWPAARELFREGDDFHAVIAPAYFRSGERASYEWRGLLEDASAAVFIAELLATGELGGLVVVRVYDTPRSPTMVQRRRGHVETVVVGATHRRRGLGRQLMTEAAAWARAHSAVELVLTTWAGNGEAEAFYKRMGYRPLSTVLSQPLT